MRFHWRLLVLVPLLLASACGYHHSHSDHLPEARLNGDWGTGCQLIYGADPHDPYDARSYIDTFSFWDGAYFGAYETYATDNCGGAPLDVVVSEGEIYLEGWTTTADGVRAERLDFEGEFTCYTLIDHDPVYETFVLGDFQGAGYDDCRSPARRHRYLDFEAVYFRY